jgi:hypothetical protein
MVYLGMTNLRQEQKQVLQVNKQLRYNRDKVIAESRLKAHNEDSVESETTDDKFNKVTEDETVIVWTSRIEVAHANTCGP